jgi:hypothetical protein
VIDCSRARRGAGAAHAPSAGSSSSGGSDDEPAARTSTAAALRSLHAAYARLRRSHRALRREASALRARKPDGGGAGAREAALADDLARTQGELRAAESRVAELEALACAGARDGAGAALGAAQAALVAEREAHAAQLASWKALFLDLRRQLDALAP